MGKDIKPYGVLDLKGEYNNPLTGKPQAIYPNSYLNLWNGPVGNLNVFKKRNEIFKALDTNQVLLLTAGTGAGKTVIMPLLVLHYFDYGNIICTQPRKNLVDDQTNFSSFLLNVPIKIETPEIDGERRVLVEDTGLRYVGKKYGGGLGPDWTTNDTKLLWATDAMIKVLITGGDELLENYNAILIDETHERSLHIDILIALCLNICTKRPDFKLIVMSATIDTELFMNYFARMGFSANSKHMHIEGVGVQLPPGIEPIKHEFYHIDISNKKRIDLVAKEVDKLLKNNEIMDKIFSQENYADYSTPPKPLKRFYKYGRDILIFAPTMSKIAEIIDTLNENMSQYKYKPKCVAYNSKTSNTDEGKIAKIKGSLLSEDLMGNDVGKYDLKVIVATNTAEAGVTFDDPLAFVFETGLQNNEFFSAKEYVYENGLFDIAKDNIRQRAGRTGRINPGICRYMYSKDQYDAFKDFKDTDITLNDITSDVLAIMCIEDYNTVETSASFIKNMIEPIENYRDIINVAYRNLVIYDFIDNETKELNKFGKICAGFSLYGFQVGRIVIMGYHLGILLDAILMGAIVVSSIRQFKDLFGEINHNELNTQRLKMLQNFIHITGDHMSLFKLMKTWLEIPEYNKELWEEVYNVKYNELRNIKYAYLEIAKITLKLLPDISELNMFVHGERVGMFGGNNTSYYNEMKAKLSNQSLLLNSVTGGNVSDTTFDNYQLTLDDFNKDISISEIINTGHSNHIYSNEIKKERVKRVNIISKKDNKIINDIVKRVSVKLNENDKSKVNTSINDIKNATHDTTVDKKKEKMKKKKKTQKVVSEEDKEIKKLLKQEINSDKFEFYNIYNKDIPIKLRYMNTYNKEERLLIALYFGLINQVGIRNTTKNKSSYIIKNSSIEGTNSNSVLEIYLNRTPKYIIYNKFNKSKRGNILTLTTELPEQVIKLFNNLKFKV